MGDINACGELIFLQLQATGERSGRMTANIRGKTGAVSARRYRHPLKRSKAFS